MKKYALVCRSRRTWTRSSGWTSWWTSTRMDTCCRSSPRTSRIGPPSSWKSSRGGTTRSINEKNCVLFFVHCVVIVIQMNNNTNNNNILIQLRNHTVNSWIVIRIIIIWWFSEGTIRWGSRTGMIFSIFFLKIFPLFFLLELFFFFKLFTNYF